jgi:alkylation response protein AidB-like acyl-CoA dehydrogenase
MTASIAPSNESERQRITECIRSRAALLDRGESDVREDIATLGDAGLLRLGLDSSGIEQMVAVIEDVSAESLAAGFSTWAHRMTLEYVDRAPKALRDRYRGALESGERIGVTAMAAGLKQVAGLGETPLIATPYNGGIEVSGPIRWASNVFGDSLIVLPARTEGGDTFVAVVSADSPGVKINTAPDLMALGATASTSLTLDRVRVPAEDIVSNDLVGFVKGIRPVFLLLQSSFCSGISRTALSEAQALLIGLGEQFIGEYRSLASDYESLRSRLQRFAQDYDNIPIRELIQLRLDGSLVAVAATRLESTLRGGAGYAAHSGTSRRFREAAFLPIQSPSEGQLRWELAQYE